LPASRPGPGLYFNTVCLASPSGELVLHYHKLNPWPYAEKSWATEGPLLYRQPAYLLTTDLKRSAQELIQARS
jgi:predicted amidohydrolase